MSDHAPKPRAREWEVGQDAYGRAVILRHGRTYDGKSTWAIETIPSGQRDEGEHIRGLSLECLRAIATVIGGER